MAHPAARGRLSELLSEGSRYHNMGRCRPCAFFHTKGCLNGPACDFCHACPPFEAQRRQRVRKRLLAIQVRQGGSAGGPSASSGDGAGAVRRASHSSNIASEGVAAIAEATEGWTAAPTEGPGQHRRVAAAKANLADPIHGGLGIVATPPDLALGTAGRARGQQCPASRPRQPRAASMVQDVLPPGAPPVLSLSAVLPPPLGSRPAQRHEQGSAAPVAACVVLPCVFVHLATPVSTPQQVVWLQPQQIPVAQAAPQEGLQGQSFGCDSPAAASGY
mmetsp:Transcript_143350/g.399620  ORF Transcript_143350/g.399620 Transcript_143350/m.399620 type:complete len:275 (+) Transcript_143350:58-882(+)